MEGFFVVGEFADELEDRGDVWLGVLDDAGWIDRDEDLPSGVARRILGLAAMSMYLSCIYHVYTGDMWK